ncbi:MAG: hypothetical protein ACREJU_06580 [Nitrospiraceae bacterium]
MTRSAAAALLCSLLMNVSPGWAAEDCPVVAEQGGVIFPVDQLDSDVRCLIAPVVARPSTRGAIGPMETPIGPELYTYLLDHPAIMVMLLERLGIDAPQFSSTGHNQFLVDDEEGAHGVLTVIHRDEGHRIYYIDGEHQSYLFPTVRARTVVFMHIETASTVERRPAVQTALVSYTQFEGRVLNGLARVFRPLVEWAVKRALVREFDLTNQLGSIIAEDPDRVRREAASLPFTDMEDRRMLSALLLTAPKTRTPSAAASLP